MTDNSMESRYILELRDRDPSTVEDLILDNCKATEVGGLDDKLVNLQALSMISVGLLSLKGLPVLPALAKLDLSDNKIAGGLDVVAKNCPSLLHLNLASNDISDVNELKVFENAKLAELDLFSNNVGDCRAKVFELIPSLQILDGCDVNGEEVADDDGSSIGAEGSIGEDGSDDGSEESDNEGPGLSFLNNSQIDEDETEDYDPEAKRGVKRSAGNEGAADEPETKKSQEDS